MSLNDGQKQEQNFQLFLLLMRYNHENLTITPPSHNDNKIPDVFLKDVGVKMPRSLLGEVLAFLNVVLELGQRSLHQFRLVRRQLAQTQVFGQAVFAQEKWG